MEQLEQLRTIQRQIDAQRDATLTLKAAVATGQQTDTGIMHPACIGTEDARRVRGGRDLVLTCGVVKTCHLGQSCAYAQPRHFKQTPCKTALFE